MSLHSFDFLGITPKLNVFGSESYKTRFGGVIGMLSIGAILVLSSYFVIDNFQRNTMSIIYTQNTKYTPSLNITSVPFMVSIVNSSTLPIDEMERYLIISAKKFEVIQIYNDTLGKNV